MAPSDKPAKGTALMAAAAELEDEAEVEAADDSDLEAEAVLDAEEADFETDVSFTDEDPEAEDEDVLFLKEDSVLFWATLEAALEAAADEVALDEAAVVAAEESPPAFEASASAAGSKRVEYHGRAEARAWISENSDKWMVLKREV